MSASIAAVFVAILVCACHSDSERGNGALPGWQLVWADEFEGTDGSRFDTTRWSAVTGGSGWGNQEREYYTDNIANVQQLHGNLVITALKDDSAAYNCWYGPCGYTSARLQTKGHFEQAYGRFEARIKMPRGQGIWPAFWMLGNDIDTAGWPACGEIDVMENIGKEPSRVHGTVHGPGYSGGGGLTAFSELPSGAVWADDFHVFAVEWEADAVRFNVDGKNYATQARADVPASQRWVFDHPFFVLLNLAVGGAWPGDPDGMTAFPQEMLIEYVRVYRKLE